MMVGLITKKRGRRLSNLIVFCILFSIMPYFVYSESASLVSSSGTVQQLYFTGQQNDVNKWYQDGISTNPDVGIRICDIGQRYVGATYAANIAGSWKYVLVSYKSSTEAMAYTSNNDGNNCYSVSPSYLTISPSSLTTPSPYVFYAAFPARLWIGYSDSSNPGSINNFVFSGSYGKLAGSYSVGRSYSQDTNKVSVQTPVINFQTSSGVFSKLASDATFGIESSKRRMVVALCSDDSGSSCSDGYIVPNEANFPLSLNSGLSSSIVNDSNTYNKYVVINGIGNKICIGANLKVTIDSLSPNPVYYGQVLHVTFRILNPRDTPNELNGGNVKVTSPFNVKITIYNSSDDSKIVYQTTQEISNDVDVDGSVSVNFNWPAEAHSGFYTIRVSVDSGNSIAECNENDNNATANFELKPVYIPRIKIDGVETIHFSYPGVPYNFSLYLTNSDGDINVSNARMQVIEENGLNVLAPTQIWNRTLASGDKVRTGLKSYNIAEFMTDYRGDASMVLIPTSNKLYSSDYNYTNITSYVGSYKIYLRGWTSDNESLVFNVNGEITDSYPLEVDHPYEFDHVTGKNIMHEDTFVKPVLEFIYEAFSSFWKAIVR